MDSQIYSLFSKADLEKNFDYVREAYKLLDPEVNTSKEKSTKDIENFSQNLFVECAERAINYQEYSIANRCIQLYFSLPMIANQFLARAYLCQFELLAPKATDQLENLEKSAPFLIKAIEFSKQNKRYNFLIYNSSIVYWKYARAFLKTNYKKHLCATLLKITQSLKEIDDADYEWRSFLEKTLIEAYLDDKKTNEANKLANELLKFTQSYMPENVDAYFKFLCVNNLLNDDDLRTISASKWELNVIYRIEKLKKSKLLKNSKKNEDSNQNEDQILNELTEIYKSILPKSNRKLDKEVDDSSQFLKSFNTGSNRLVEFAANKKRQKLLLNLAHLSLFFDEVNLCSQILGYLKEAELTDDDFLLELEFIDCDLSVRQLKHKKERYSKNIVKIRIESIRKCHEMLQNALRLNNFHLVQFGCLTQWNLCLPLLQPSLRVQVRKYLQYVADCLEKIESMEWLLRCQVHFELAKCDEEIEQLQTAEQHLLKAMQFDDEKVHYEQLEHVLKRLRLRAELYKTPELVDDQVGMILEQCVVSDRGDKRLKPAITELLETLDKKKNGSESGAVSSQINIHSLLLRAGDLLAPNEFTRVLESETFKANLGKMNEDQISRLAKKALNYESCVKKGANHLQDRLGDLERDFNRSRTANSADSAANSAATNANLESLLKMDYKQRLKLWFDLSRIARKQQIWDICRVSCRFCILYDNESLVSRFLKGSNQKFSSLFNKDLMRNLAEAHFILGEALVQYIRGEGLELFETPKEPRTNDVPHISRANVHRNKNLELENKHTESTVERNFENDKEWLEYCDWLNRLSKESIDHFLKGIQIGIQLNESWLVSQGSAYVWNYLHHIFVKKKFNQVIPILSEVLDGLKKVGHNTEPELLVAVCVALSNGLMQNWLPPEHVKSLQIPELNGENASPGDKPGKKANLTNAAHPSSKPFVLSNEAQADMKKALDVVDYAMQVTNGDNLSNVVTLKDRFPLIKTWVLAKQLNQSAIKNYGIVKNNSGIDRIQDKYTRCMIGIEILNRNLKMSNQSNFEIKEPPSIKEICNLIDQAQTWPDRLVELELWSNLCVLSCKANQLDNLRYCHSKAFESCSYFEKIKNDNKNVYLTSQLLLCEACIALGENLSNLLLNPTGLMTSQSNQKQQHRDNTHSSNASFTSNYSSRDARIALRRNAINAFSDAASHAAKAQNYEHMVHAARQFWNLCLPYLKQPAERATVLENLREILTSWQAVYKFKPVVDKSDKNESENGPTNKQDEKKDAPENENKPTKATAANKATSKQTKESTANVNESKKKREAAGSPGKRASSKSPQKTLNTSDQSGGELAVASSNTAADFKSNSEKAFNPYEDAFDDLTLRSVLYACMFQILIDRNHYEEALNEMALNDLPRTKHRMLIYRFKVIIKSKLGQDVQMDLQKFREESEKNLAQMYRKVALSSIKHTDTINCYQRAIETLSSEESVWLKFEYILELSQWMYSNEYNLESCIDLAEWAIDLIMFNVKSAEKVDKSSRLLSASTTPSGRQSKNQNKRLGNKIQTSLLPTIVDEVTEIKIVHGQMEKSAEEEMENLIRKSKRENLFESASVNKSLNWTEVDDIRQLECLLRAHVILAQMSHRSSDEYSSYLFKAYYILHRLIQQAVDNGLVSLKEIQKLNALAENATGANEKDKKKGAPDGKKSNLGFTGGKKLKPDGTSGAAAYLPQNLEQWSVFEFGDELVHAWSHDLMKKTGINVHTISEPYLLFYYLEMLDRMLRELGYSQVLFPLYNLQLLLVNSVFKSTPNMTLNVYVRMKLINLCVELNLISSVNFHQQSLATLILNLKSAQPQQPIIDASNVTGSLEANPTLLLKLLQIDAGEVSLVREQIHGHKQRLSQLQEEEACFNSTSMTSFSVPKKDQLKLRKKQSSQANSKKTSLSSKNRESSSNGGSAESSFQLTGEMKKLDDNMAELLYKDVWVLIAEFLVENGFLHTARDYLYECLNASISFDDETTLAKVQYLLAKICVFDFNFIEAREFASKAQKVAIDELFWYKTVRVLVDAHKYDYNDKDGYDKSIKILTKALDLVEQEKQRRKNKWDKLAYIQAMLKFEFAEISRDGVLNGKFNDQDLIIRQKLSKKMFTLNSIHPLLFKKLSAVCETYQECIEQLLSNNYKREAVQIIKSHARLLKTFANDCNNLDSKHDYLLQAHFVLNDGLNLMDEVYVETLSLQSPNEQQNVSLAVQRELVDLKLELAQLLTDILELELKKVRDINENNLNKDKVLRTLENFVDGDQNTNYIETQWNSMVSKLPDLLLSNLVSCHNLSSRLKYFRSLSSYFIGRTYRLISELALQLKRTNLNEKCELNLSMLLPVSKWNDLIIDIYRNLAQQLTSDSDLNTNTAPNRVKSKSIKSALNSSQQFGDSVLTPARFNEHGAQDAFNFTFESNTDANIIDTVYENSHFNVLESNYIKSLISITNNNEAQATECLIQALNFAFSLDDKQLCQNITLELIEIIGRFDMSLCSQLIALYQSFTSAAEAERLIEKCSADPKNSLLSGYFNQKKFYQNMNVKHNSTNSPLVKHMFDITKSKFNAFKFLDVNSNHFNYSKELPANYIVLVLQHNAAKTEIYAAILDRSKPGSQGVAGGKTSKLQNSSSPVLSKSMVTKVKSDPLELKSLKQEWKDWKKELQSFYLKIEFQLHNFMGKNATTGATSTNKSPDPSTLSQNDQLNEYLKHYIHENNPKYAEMLDYWNELQYKFQYLIGRTENFFAKINDFVQSYFNLLSKETAASQASTKVPAPQTSLKPTDRLILLADVDLQELPLETMSVFHHNQSICSITRDFSLHFFITRLTLLKEAEQNKVEDKKVEKTSKTNAKQGQTVAEPLPENAITLDHTKVKYLVDVYNEANIGIPDDLTSIGAFKRQMQKYPQTCAKWSGIMGLDHISSVGEREKLLLESNCFIFNGCERFLSYFNSNKIASFNLNECRLVLINDQAQTNKSYVRVGKSDVNRNPTELECENPIEESLLLTLTGVKTLLVNQWSSTVVENSMKFAGMLKEFLDSRQSCGEVVRYQIAPHLKKILSDNLKREEELKKILTENKSKESKAKKENITKKSLTKKNMDNLKEDPIIEEAKQGLTDANEYDPEAAAQQQQSIDNENLLQELSIPKLENANMICFGLPDLFLCN